MKQVADVAYASQNCVDLYVRSLAPGTGRLAFSEEQAGGILGYFRPLARLLWTLPARHHVAVQIRELKVRAREVGERRLRYGVELPPRGGYGASSGSVVFAGDDDDGTKDKEQEDAQRRALAEAEPSPFPGSLSVTCWLSGHGAKLLKKKGTPRVIALVGHNAEARAHIARTSFRSPWVATSRPSDCMAWIQLGKQQSPVGQSTLLRDILVKLAPPEDQLEDGIAKQLLMERIQQHLQGKRFLIVLDDVGEDHHLYDGVKSAFLNTNCSPGSAILVTIESLLMAAQLCPDEIYRVESMYPGLDAYLTDFYFSKVISLLNNNHKITYLEPVLRAILAKLVYQTHNCKLFLYALYVNPSRALEDFQTLQGSLVSLSSLDERQIMRFAYNGLSSNCKNCLRHLIIFPKNTTFRRTRLVRRWAAEGMVTKRGRLGALVEADHCFDVLVAHKFVMPKDTDVTGKVKSCVMHGLIHDLVTNIASYDHFHNTNLPLELAHRLPIHNAFQLQEATQQLHAAHSKVYPKNICCLFMASYPEPEEIDESNAIKILLESLPFAQVGVLEVLDLEECKELKDHHLRNICNHVPQLKYLSLRNTDITELPKQIDKLQYLETLDIRQTKVQAFAKNSVVLPKLKHLLAGHQNDCKSQNTTNSEEQFATVKMPKSIGTMTELQVLSHVGVFGNGEELIDIGKLLQLRKLGIVLNECEEHIMRHLYRAIEILPGLRSLSIRKTADKKNAEINMSDTTQQLLMPPKYLQTLEISGLTGIPKWIENMDELSKIALHDTLLAVDEIVFLGKLTRLCCLTLGEKSYSESTLTFSRNGFQSLKFLVIDCSTITNVNFVEKSTPKLEKIVLSLTALQSLSGIEFLQTSKSSI